MFEFGARGATPREFVDALDPFLARLPEGFRYAVEVRNRGISSRAVFDALRARRRACAERLDPCRRWPGR